MKEIDARAKTITRMMFSLFMIIIIMIGIFRMIIIIIKIFRMIVIIIRIIQDDDDDDQDTRDALRIIMKMMSRAAVQQIGDPKIMRETALIIIIIFVIESQLSTSRIHTIFWMCVCLCVRPHL